MGSLDLAPRFKNLLSSGRVDSLVPYQVINAVRIMSPGSEFDFAGALIAAAFTQGRNISDLSVCLDVVQESGFDRDKVAAILTTPELIRATEQSFAFAGQVGTGFPSLFLKTQGGLFHLGGADLDLKKATLAIEAHLN